VYGQYGLVVKTPVDYLPSELIKINQHPTRKYFGGDGFYGLVPHAATLLYHDYMSLEYAYSECICHEALAEYDTGKVIMRQRVLLETTMTPSEAQKRALFHEWQCQASALLRIYEEGWPLDEFPELLDPLDIHYADMAKEEALSAYGRH
jgi:folate-dependent phosphoribosylglycinamide formyltransferase PurN